MNNLILKYGPVEPCKHPQDWTIITIPEYAEFRHFGAQNGKLFAWYEVNMGCIKSEVQLMVIGTGWDVPEGATYRGTCIVDGFVWHLYERF